ncbi:MULTISPECIES: N-6 DNA methylase [Pseudomonadota]|uniref:Eco57I restriction-modification methylase domain-containing protein n=1 Tax=Pseudomonadota TaxID=1224 RepID=UPI002730B6B3|nr:MULTISPECIES: N-6 DNA methylase [Pseudomonadota]MDP1627651.1 N-6 DNA methylase [Parvibaculum sp.]MDP2243753.1 N-6 DNA methylase [Pseudomonas sp.]
MARKPITDMTAWPSLTLEGNLIAPAMVAQISDPKDDTETRESYGIRKGLTIREEISTAFRVGQSHFDAFAKLEDPSAETTRRFMRDFLKETFGFTDLTPSDGATSFIGGGRIPIVVVPPVEEKLDRRSPTLSTDRSRSPAFALQDYLNEHDEALWGLVTNGTLLRLMRDNASFTRPAYIEADLAQIFTNEDVASFTTLWLLIHRSRFGASGTPATDCALERWREVGSREGEAARDRLAGQVQIALKILGSGFLEANPDLAVKLKSGEVNLIEWFNELLRLVYRLIFLMVAEDRNLLHPDKANVDARKLYADGYSLAALRAQSFRAPTWDKHFDRFEGIKIVFRALAHGEERLALPALGGLFLDDKLPHLETARLRNRAFMESLYRLSWLDQKTGMVPVNWRAMETEELGSVYESLLELQPQLGDDGKTLLFASEAAEQKGNQRKTTGSYYTPDRLVQALLDAALDTVLDKTEAEADDPAKALLKLSVIDPACGSGHFLLAAARRIATRLARIRADGTPSLADFRHALRDVARSCLHGVDRNPMAVELTKVALWIETVDPGLPLGFFDAQIRCGDALLGVFDLKVLRDGIPDAAYKPLTGDDKDTAKYYLQANRAATSGQGGFDFGTGQVAMPEMKPLALDFSGFRELPEDTVEQIGTKAARFEALRKGQAFVRAAAAANLYVAAFLLPKVGGAPAGRSTRTVPTTEELWLALNQGKIRQAMMDAPKAARHARAFHWPLEFPDVMQRGGFDVVLGNPPWDQIELDPEGFFANSAPEIAEAKNKAQKDKTLDRLKKSQPQLYETYERAAQAIWATQQFIHESGRFPTSSFGRLNTAPLFVELSMDLSGLAGRVGLVVPSGIANDSFNQKLFNRMFDEKRLSALVDFENREGIFPAVDSRAKFSLLSLGREQGLARFASFLTNTSQLTDPERQYTLTPDQIGKLNPNSRTAPVFRARADAELAAKIYSRCPVLWEEDAKDGNPWNISFQLMFMMSASSGDFKTAVELSEMGLIRDGTMWVDDSGSEDRQKWLKLVRKLGPEAYEVNENRPVAFVPLYEGKMTSLFDHRAAGYGARGDDRGYRVLPETTHEEHCDPSFETEPFYWVDQLAVEQRLFDRTSREWLIGWKDVTSATNERTAIFSVIPRVAVGHSMPLMFTGLEARRFVCLMANTNSMPFDYVARLKVAGLHLTYGYFKQLPVLPPDSYTEARLAFITPKVLELTYTSHSLAPFARDLGHDGPPFAWNEDRRALLRADLDAFYTRAYGLTRDELRYILDPADVKGPDYPSETFRVLKEKEIRHYGEYRTRRLVLEAWDRMEADGTFVKLGLAEAVATPAPPSIRLPPLESIPAGVWAWPHGVDERDRIRAQLRAMLGILPNPSEDRRVRLATLACLQPSLLDDFLPDADRKEWRRIVAHPPGVTRLVPPTNAAWGAAFNELESSAVLSKSPDGAQWSAGPKLDRSTLHVDDPAVGRALFAWSRLQSLNLDDELPKLSADIISFIREGRLAA